MKDWAEQMREIHTIIAEVRRRLDQCKDLLSPEGAVGVGVRNRPVPPVLPGAVALPLPPETERE